MTDEEVDELLKGVQIGACVYLPCVSSCVLALNRILRIFTGMEM